MPASPIRRLAPYADAAKARGTQVYHLNIGQPDLQTPPQFFEAIAKADVQVLAYSPSAGHESYRAKLVGYYANYGITHLGPEHITVTTGGSEALRFAFAACFNPGDEVIIPEPFYANYASFATENGVVIRPISTTVEDSFELPDPAEIEQAITPRTKALLLCNPSNPTGKLYNRSALEQLARLVLKYDLYLIADEVYKEFCYDGYAFTSALTLSGLEAHVVVVDSVSKRYSGCGARIGAFVSRNADLNSTVLKFAQARLSPPTLGQIGAEALIDLPQSYYQQIVKTYSERRDIVLDALRQLPGVVAPTVSGAFYVMPKLPIDNADRFCQWLLESFSHEGHTVMLAPGTGFYATPGRGTQEVRLAYVLEPAKLRHAMACLALALETYPNRVPVAAAAV